MKISPRVFFITLAVLCLGLVAFAYYLQHGERQQPCPLCILQRYAYLFIAAFALVAGLHNPDRIGRLIYLGFIDLISASGLGLAIWQLTKGDTMQSCLADPIGDFVNRLPSANWWPELFFATGGCADKYPPIMGLSVPTWSLVCFAAITSLSGWMMAKSMQKPARS